MDITNGVSMPLPDYWLVEVPKTSVLDNEPDYKVTKQDVAPHAQAIILNTNALNTFND